jgi:curved DNA-binding protein
MAFIDYYKIMGVDKNIPQDEVRDAYRRRAKQFHPDLHPNDPKAKAKFQALNEAYSVISDPEKRKKYDQYGEHWKDAGDFGNEAYSANGSSANEFHWGTSGESSPFDGFNFDGFNERGGASSFFEQLFGSGRKTNSHRTYRQNTGQLSATVNIDLYTALLGGIITIQLNGGTKLRLKVKEGTQNGTKVRLRGKGSGRGDGTYGDLIITYNVLLPTSLNDRQRHLLQQIRDER